MSTSSNRSKENVRVGFCSLSLFYSDVLHSVLVSLFMVVHVLANVGHGHHFFRERMHYRSLPLSLSPFFLLCLSVRSPLS